jgi:hypothetical protein
MQRLTIFINIARYKLQFLDPPSKIMKNLVGPDSEA